MKRTPIRITIDGEEVYQSVIKARVVKVLDGDGQWQTAANGGVLTIALTSEREAS